MLNKSFRTGTPFTTPSCVWKKCYTLGEDHPVPTRRRVSLKEEGDEAPSAQRSLRMISTNLQGVAELVIRQAQRQGYIVPRQVRTVLTQAGISESLWKDVLAVARSSL